MAITDIDPVGDVLFDIGEERFRVSSKVLSLASPVFKAMFTSGFKESIISTVTANNPSIISLPDDDPRAMMYLCQIIHLQQDKLVEAISREMMESLGLLCDKYQCTSAVSNFAEWWLGKLSKGLYAVELSRLLQAAYLLDAPTAFSSISWKLLQDQMGDFEGLLGDKDFPMLPRQLIIDDFNSLKSKVFRNLAYAIMRPVGQLTATNCTNKHAYVGLYVHELELHNILVGSPEIDEMSIAETRTEASQISPKKLGPSSPCPQSCCCRGADYYSNMWKSVGWEVEDLLDCETGLCLDCIKTGHRSKSEGTCRATHY